VEKTLDYRATLVTTLSIAGSKGPHLPTLVVFFARIFSFHPRKGDEAIFKSAFDQAVLTGNTMDIFPSGKRPFCGDSLSARDVPSFSFSSSNHARQTYFVLGS